MPDDVNVRPVQGTTHQSNQKALDAKAAHIRAVATKRADNIRKQAEQHARQVIARGERHAAKIEGVDMSPHSIKRTIRLDVHGRPKPLLRGWIHAIAAPLVLAAGIVLICLAHGTSLKWACAVFMVCSLTLFTNSAAYHLGSWSPHVTDILRRIDHMNIFLLITGTYTPVSFALSTKWRTIIIVGMWICTVAALTIHIIWINAPRWLYTIVYIIFGVNGVAYMGLFWQSSAAGPTVVFLLLAGGACYIIGAVIYALRKPDPWPRVFGFHEIFHLCTVAGYTCHIVAIYMVVINLW
jgi:hemolysin III